MKAVIMAGGEGRRLRPVTGEMPKPMVKLLGKPMMEHILLLLKKHGYTDICAAVKYRAEEIEEYFGDGSRFGVRLQYRVESKALGTAGGVKNCADFYGSEDFLVISGDAACDFDLERLMQLHRSRKSAVTLALHRSSTPLSYGLAVTDADSQIRAFIEKPDWRRVVTDLVNTGIYILSPAVMELVPEGKPFDFAKDLFPLLMGKGIRPLGFALEGYWCDVGNPLSYYQCCVDALEGRLEISPADSFLPPAPAESSDDDEGWDFIECQCLDRARLMGELSRLTLDMGADYSDGIRISSPGYSLHISPVSEISAVRVAYRGEDEEFARELAFSAKNMIEELNL